MGGREVIRAWLLSLFFTILYCLLTPSVFTSDPRFYEFGDRHQYLSPDPIAPFCWRVGNPWLTSLFPDRQIGFYVVAALSLLGLGVLVYHLVNHFHEKHALSSIGFFYGIWWVGGYGMLDFWLTDLPAMFFILLGTVLWLKDKIPGAVIAVMIGALFKETAPLFFGVLASVLLWSWKPLLAAVPGVLVHLGVRASNPQQHVTGWPVRSWSLAYLPSNVLLTGLAVLAWNWRYALYLAVVYAQLLVASDTERLIAYGFPVMVLMAVDALKQRKPAEVFTISAVSGMLGALNAGHLWLTLLLAVAVGCILATSRSRTGPT